MKFELVDFYPITDKNRGNCNKNFLGTVHLYIIDCQFDLRGIRVCRQGKKIYFHLPHVVGNDHETGEKIRYPVFRFTNQKDHEEMMDFLHKEVKPTVFEKIKAQK